MAFRFARTFTTMRARMPTTVPAIFTKAKDAILSKTTAAFLGGALVATPVLTGEDFFEHKFISAKNPDDIVDFYSTEDFLCILGVFPIALKFVLAGVEWDTERDNTMSVHNAMEISFELTEREEQTESGEKVVAFFQKRERFKNFIPFTRFLIWDQVQCYGYNRREDGTLEVFHRGEYFNGPLPVRLLVQLHARYVIWATEKHLNSAKFGNASLEDQEHQRSNIPAFVFSDFLHRLSVAHQIAIETGKIAAGTTTAEAEQTLKKLKKLQQSPTTQYVNTLRTSNLKRNLSRIEVNDGDAQKVINSALANVAGTQDGRDEVNDMMNDLKVNTLKPTRGGAYRGRELRRQASLLGQ